MIIKTVKELKCFLDQFPDDLRVISCCSGSMSDGIRAKVFRECFDDPEDGEDYDYVWIGYI